MSARLPAPIRLTARRRKAGARFDLLFLGDTCFGESYQRRRADQGQENILSTHGYDRPFELMQRILARSDFVVANLETPVTDAAASLVARRKRYVHKGDVVKAPPALRRNRIAAVSLANNHAFDYGAEGLAQTISVLDAEGLTVFGAGFSRSEADEPLLLELDAGRSVLRVAVFAAHDGSAATARRHRDVEGPQSCLLDPVRIGERIAALRRHDPDLLAIAFPHWGLNYCPRNARQALLAGRLLDAGIDLILGHGAHMLQEVECRRGKWAAFGLGNFVFNSPGRYDAFGAPPFSLVARLVAWNGQEGWSVWLRLYPIVTDNALTDYRPRFVDALEFEAVRDMIAPNARRPRPRASKDSNGRYLAFPVRLVGRTGEAGLTSR